ncbi:non-ribosomal peptide synthetase [Acinetobacter pittii]|uniref:non-ribosomal peptide synthetase n=1 Tax=Acinetobacter pittii TaxID=48296 RepID=UPI0021CE0B45|nr:non-ribosomal peptide synthetase [Acinetobacter pittii]MCU4528174.1 non-ribosomal peptide synthetase [Acinetobacter pittii]
MTDLLGEFNNIHNRQFSKKPYVAFDEYFSEICKQYTNRTAISTLSSQISFDDLYQKVCYYRSWLIEKEILPGARVGLMLSKSPELICVMLACVCNGITYVPLDLSFPSELIQRNILDVDITTLIVGPDFKNQHLPISISMQSFVLPSIDDFCVQSVELRLSKYSQNFLAYIIFTSGSTGRQKAVGVPVMSLIASTEARVKFYRSETVKKNLLISSVAFDSSVGVIYGSLFSGDNLFIPPPLLEKDPLSLLEVIDKENVTSILTLPSYIRVLLESVHCLKAFSRLERLIFAGEEVYVSDASRIFNDFPHISVFNEYGPTESTVWATGIQLTSSAYNRGGSVFIGYPVEHVRVYVLDAELNKIKCGERGELYIAGENLASGYLNNSSETASRFLPDPYGIFPGSRMYRTGDIVIMGGDGTLTFIGRSDRQVKIDGYRVELSEVENAAIGLTNISDAASVFISDNFNKQIELFVVSSSPESNIRRMLGNILPKYMLPTVIHFTNALPRLPNGKYDYQSLIVLAMTSKRNNLNNVIESDSDLLIQVRTIWELVLRRSDISVDDNFFDLGGTSIKAVMILNRLQRQFGISLYIGTLFEKPTIRGICLYLEKNIFIDN